MLTVDLKDVGGGLYPWAGCKLWFTAKVNLFDSDANAVIRKDSDPGGGITFPSDGVAKIAIAHADTVNLPTQKVTLHCDVQLKTAGGKINTVESGKVTVSPDATLAV